MMVLMIEDELARFFFHFNGGPFRLLFVERFLFLSLCFSLKRSLIFSVILMGPGALL